MRCESFFRLWGGSGGNTVEQEVVAAGPVSRILSTGWQGSCGLRLLSLAVFTPAFAKCCRQRTQRRGTRLCAGFANASFWWIRKSASRPRLAPKYGANLGHPAGRLFLWAWHYCQALAAYPEVWRAELFAPTISRTLR